MSHRCTITSIPRAPSSSKASRWRCGELQSGYARGKHLAWLLERIDKQRTYYLMGKMMVGKELKEVTDINLYRPADFDGKVLRLHYATAEELGPYLNMVAAGEVYGSFGYGRERHL